MQDLIVVSEPSAPRLDPSSSASSGEPPEIQMGDSEPFEWEAQDWPDLADLQDNEEPFNNIHRDDFQLLPQEPFHPLPQAENEEAQAGPSNTQAAQGPGASNDSYRALDDQDDTHFVLEHPTAGAVLGHNPNSQPPPPATSCALDSDGDIAMGDDSMTKTPFFPFNSELDWKVAEWAIKDGPGHKAFDRLLSIPGVS